MKHKTNSAKSTCEFRNLDTDVMCGEPAPFRVMIEKVDVKNYRKRTMYSDKYLCKRHMVSHGLMVWLLEGLVQPCQIKLK